MSLFGGVWADRHNRKWLIIGADAAIAASTLFLAIVMLAGFTEPWLIFVVLAVRSAGAGVQMPAVSALIPQIAPPTQHIRVNGFLGSIQSAMALIAPAAAGLIYAANTAGDASPLAIVPILFVDVVTAVIGIGLLSTIPVATIRSGASAATGVIADLVEGIRYIGDHAFVRWVLVLFGIIFVLTVAPANLMPLMLVRSSSTTRRSGGCTSAPSRRSTRSGTSSTSRSSRCASAWEWSWAGSSSRRSRRAGIGSG